MQLWLNPNDVDVDTPLTQEDMNMKGTLQRDGKEPGEWMAAGRASTHLSHHEPTVVWVRGQVAQTHAAVPLRVQVLALRQLDEWLDDLGSHDGHLVLLDRAQVRQRHDRVTGTRNRVVVKHRDQR